MLGEFWDPKDPFWKLFGLLVFISLSTLKGWLEGQIVYPSPPSATVYFGLLMLETSSVTWIFFVKLVVIRSELHDK